MSYKPGEGVTIYPDDGSRYGFLVSYEEPNKYLKNGAIRISEIVRGKPKVEGSPDNWKFRMRDMTPEQMERKRYLKSLYIWPNTVDALIWGIQDIRKRHMNVEGSMEAEAVAQDYEKRAQTKDEDKAFQEFGELAGEDVPIKQEAADEEVPF